MSGGGSDLDVGRETAMEKEPSANLFLVKGGRERERVVSVLHIGDGRPMACRSGGNTAQHRSPIPSQTHTRRGQIEANPGHCSTRQGPNH
jgi:hypothetical protein